MIAPRPAAVHHPLQVRGQPDRVGHLGHQRRARPSRHAPAIGGDVEPRTVSASVHLQGEPSSWMVRASITRIFPGREGFPMQPTPAPRQSRETSRLGIAIGGYTPGQALSERYEIMVAGGHCTGPEDENAGTSNSLRWRGQGEAITRLVLGFGVDLPKVLQTNLGVPDDQLAPVLDV